MKLSSHWRHIARKAWSFRLMLLAAVLTGLEALLPLFGHAVPPLAVFGLVAAALIARLVAQKGFE